MHSSTFADTLVDVFTAVSTVREAEDHATLQASSFGASALSLIYIDVFFWIHIKVEGQMINGVE